MGGIVGVRVELFTIFLMSVRIVVDKHKWLWCDSTRVACGGGIVWLHIPSIQDVAHKLVITYK